MTTVWENVSHEMEAWHEGSISQNSSLVFRCATSITSIFTWRSSAPCQLSNRAARQFCSLCRKNHLALTSHAFLKLWLENPRVWDYSRFCLTKSLKMVKFCKSRLCQKSASKPQAASIMLCSSTCPRLHRFCSGSGLWPAVTPASSFIGAGNRRISSIIQGQWLNHRRITNCLLSKSLQYMFSHLARHPRIYSQMPRTLPSGSFT